MVVERDSRSAVPAVRPARGRSAHSSGVARRSGLGRQRMGTPKVRWSAAHSAVHVLDLKRGPRRAKAASHHVRRLVAGGRLPGANSWDPVARQAVDCANSWDPDRWVVLAPGIQSIERPSRWLTPGIQTVGGVHSPVAVVTHGFQTAYSTDS